MTVLCVTITLNIFLFYPNKISQNHAYGFKNNVSTKLEKKLLIKKNTFTIADFLKEYKKCYLKIGL